MVQVAVTKISIEELEKVFADSPKLGHEQLLHWKTEHHADFLHQSIELLERGQGNSFTQIILKLLRQDSSSLRQLIATSELLSLEDAVRLLRLTSQNDPGYQNLLISNVKVEINHAGGWIAKQELTRLLEILSRSANAEDMASILTLLSEHPDARLRSKVAMLAGSLIRQQPKCAELLRDLDPRVRANAVASLWGRRDPESIQIFKTASLDGFHRVAANGLLGLYRAGEISSVRGILKLTRDEDPDRQLAGAWLIGQTADPRFKQIVADYLPVKTGRIKLALLNAERKIQKRMEELKEMPGIEMELVCFDRYETGRVRASILLRHADGNLFKPNDLIATEVILSEGEMRVDQFHFEARGSTEPMHQVFLIPQRSGSGSSFHGQIEEGMELAISGKRQFDHWSIQKYNTSESGTEREPTLIDFSVDAKSLISHQLRDLEGASSNLMEGIELAIHSFPAAAKCRQLVVILNPELQKDLAVPADLSILLEKQKIILNVLSSGALDEPTSRSWWQLCSDRRGAYLETKQASELTPCLARLAAALPGYFYLTYRLGRITPSPGPLERVSIEVLPADGYAQMVIQGISDWAIDAVDSSYDEVAIGG